jgi:hypothetical protein
MVVVVGIDNARWSLIAVVRMMLCVFVRGRSWEHEGASLNKQ